MCIVEFNVKRRRRPSSKNPFGVQRSSVPSCSGTDVQTKTGSNKLSIGVLGLPTTSQWGSITPHIMLHQHGQGLQITQVQYQACLAIIYSGTIHHYSMFNCLHNSCTYPDTTVHSIPYRFIIIHLRLQRLYKKINFLDSNNTSLPTSRYTPVSPQKCSHASALSRNLPPQSPSAAPRYVRRMLLNSLDKAYMNSG